MRVGEGRRTKFWKGKWIADASLKRKFPRLYLISLQRDEAVANMEFWGESHWQWNLTWRRYLFQWEMQLLEDLLKTLQDSNLSNNISDKVRWTHNSKGCFTFKSFSNE